ncbi:cellulose synthase-like protein B4 [Malania oleifera]|uniref:cellulose synthase-like protein B4 n=1 Tax=Malania oleifera TaxID=397392 RepID=UPI0025AE6F0C|nr:cellulose synthase-like protein B4 [Malania oleifera]
MPNSTSLPLHERITCKNNAQRALDVTILFLLLSLISYRLLSINRHGFAWLVAFLCESWFTFVWALAVSTKWNIVKNETYPDRLSKQASELPAVDIFVTTADPVLEPPMLTVDTVLSLLAVDYPAHKLACYVSDDGCSPLTFFSLVEASKFARLWVPFCKMYGVQDRAPFIYFSDDHPMCPSGGGVHSSFEFQQNWKMMKDEYEQLCQKVEAASQKPTPFDLTGEFEVFSNIERKNHPTIIKVIWENKENVPDGGPHLVYISREKRPKHQHHYKAGAMNVLTRVSGVMTNAPFILNVDCDMYANDPQIVLHAMCLLLGFDNIRYSGFVQFPQEFSGGSKVQPFGDIFVVMQQYLLRGFAGIQGAPYSGTGCFHRRKIIYGLLPDDTKLGGPNFTSADVRLSSGKLADLSLQKIFGQSSKLCKSASYTLSEMGTRTECVQSLSASVKAAYQVAGCDYDYGTSWGTKVGWVYGSLAEDNLFGITIHSRGWGSVYCTPNRPAFLGFAPPGGPSAMAQQKRWVTGFFEILASRSSPFVAIFATKLQFRQGLAYIWFYTWGLRSVPELCYAALPACCIISNSYFVPKVHEPAMFMLIAIFALYNLSTLSEYLRTGFSIRAWWKGQTTFRIITVSAWLFGALNITLKLLGVSETTFEITQKGRSTLDEDGKYVDPSEFTFDESLVFAPGTTLVLVHFAALVMEFLGFQRPSSHHGNGAGVGEIICSLLVVITFWPFVKGLFGRGRHGIPSSTIWKSTVVAFLLLQLCKWASVHETNYLN